jgi:hypothetical protein
MSISKTQWVSDCRDGLLALGKDVPPDVIEGGLNYCLQQLADHAASHDEIRARLQKTHSITLTSGVATLPTTLLTSPVAIDYYLVTLANTNNPLQFLPNLHDRYNPPSHIDYLYYTIGNNQITVFNYQGTVTSETALTVYGSYVPLITEVPDVLSDDFAAIGIAWGSGALAQEAA